MSDVLILREDDVRASLSMDACIDAMAEAFAAYSGGRAELPAVIHLEIPEHHGEIHVKGGFVHGGNHYAVKFASGFPGNTELGLAPNDGLVVVFDARTGAPAAFLLDHGFITDQRTGAAGGVAARHLTPETFATVAVIGTGLQARYQLDALAAVRSFDEVRVWGRDAQHALACVDELRARPGLPNGTTYALARSVEEAVLGADVVITCTASREPLVLDEWVVPGMHLTAVGSDGPGKQELDPQILARAEVLVVDSRPQCIERGELQHALDLLDAGAVPELGQVVSGQVAGRTDRNQVSVCDLTGVGVQDVAAASVVLTNALGAGRGESLAP
jgi:ornithine cyclodeaminase/alanine dehydrogenase-like protein (mu-crystallin family)